MSCAGTALERPMECQQPDRQCRNPLAWTSREGFGGTRSRLCQITPAEKTRGGREAAWWRCSLPSCLHLPHSHSEVANCGNRLQPSRAGPGCWPARFYRASRSQSDCEELGQLSNFEKAAPFSCPRCYNKYKRCEEKKKRVHSQGAHVGCEHSSKWICGATSCPPCPTETYTPCLHLPANFPAVREADSTCFSMM